MQAVQNLSCNASVWDECKWWIAKKIFIIMNRRIRRVPTKRIFRWDRTIFAWEEKTKPPVATQTDAVAKGQTRKKKSDWMRLAKATKTGRIECVRNVRDNFTWKSNSFDPENVKFINGCVHCVRCRRSGSPLTAAHALHINFLFSHFWWRD